MIQAALRKARRFFLGAGNAKRREPEAFALAALLGPIEWFPLPESAELLRHLLGLPEENRNGKVPSLSVLAAPREWM